MANCGMPKKAESKIIKKPAKSTAISSNVKTLDDIYKRIAEYLRESRSNVVRSINTAMVITYWQIGREIHQEELKGKERADYGKELLHGLAARLTISFGKGFTATNLRYMKRFYLAFPEEKIQHAVRAELSQVPEFNVSLSWTHYRLLAKITSKTARSFYEYEAAANNWSSRELERQINSLLFERLAKSKDKAGLMRLAKRGQEVQQPEDAIKDPFVLEFLSLPESHRLVESKLEEALTTRLQEFLLELGKGFAFVARQKRITLDGDHFYIDLVFYHAILKCYVLIDLKTKKLTHGDLGQMLHYVNYFDNECVTPEDNPTIGLILCTEKNDTMVKYTLGEKKQQIFASKYQFHLPTEEQLAAELKRELKEIKDNL